MWTSKEALERPVVDLMYLGPVEIDFGLNLVADNDDDDL